MIESQTGRRSVTPADFYIAELTTAIEPGEMLREIRFPKLAPGTTTAFVESGNRQEGLAIAGIACTLQLDQSGACAAVTLAAIGVGSGPMRLVSAEQALMGHQPDGQALNAAAEAAIGDIDPRDDIHASAHYRTRLAVALVKRAVERARAA